MREELAAEPTALSYVVLGARFLTSKEVLVGGSLLFKGPLSYLVLERDLDLDLERDLDMDRDRERPMVGAPPKL